MNSRKKQMRKKTKSTYKNVPRPSKK